MRAIRKGTVWITLGLLLMGAALACTLLNLYEDYAAGESTRSVLSEMRRLTGDTAADPSAASLPAPPVPTALTNPLPAFVTHPAVFMPTVLIDGYRYIGTLDFPDMGLSFPVMDSWDYDRLKLAPCLFSGSIYQHDAVICAHDYAAHFGPLKNAQPGENAVFTDMDGNRFTYTLSRVDILSPEAVEEMTVSPGDWELTVFTCTTGGKTRTTLRYRLTEVSYGEGLTG